MRNIKENADYFDSINIAPAIAIVAVLVILGYGFVHIIFLSENDEKEVPVNTVVEQNIQVGEYTEGTVIEENLRVIVEGDSVGTEQEIDQAIQELIESEKTALEQI